MSDISSVIRPLIYASDARKLIGIAPVLQQFLKERQEHLGGGTAASDSLAEIVHDLEKALFAAGLTRPKLSDDYGHRINPL